jgi:hypothetical protein
MRTRAVRMRRVGRMLRPGRASTQPLAKGSKKMSEITSKLDRFEELRASFEALRDRMEALEATAHAATELFTEFPYMPRKPLIHEPTDKETFRRTFRRMQSLVLTTASGAESVLDAMDDLSEQIERVMEQRADPSPQSAGPDDNDSDDDEPSGQGSPTFQ